MKFFNRWIGFMLAVGLIGGYALAQQVVDQGRPGKEGPWPVTIISGGTGGGGSSSSITVQDAPCASPRDSFYVPDGGVCPPTALAGRRLILICNAPKNTAFGAPFVTITVDGQTPNTSLSSPGQDLGVGDCLTYNIPASTQTRCIFDTPDAGLKITECQ